MNQLIFKYFPITPIKLKNNAYLEMQEHLQTNTN